MRRIYGNGGTGGGGAGSGTRTNALWGKGRKRYSLLLVNAVIVMAVTAGTTTAHATDISNLVRHGSEPSTPAASQASRGGKGGKKPFVPEDLKDKANREKGNTEKTFSVIIQASDPGDLSSVDKAVGRARDRHPGRGRGVQRTFATIGVVTADVTGDQLDELAADDSIAAITEDAEVHPTGFSNPQAWVGTIDAEWGGCRGTRRIPTIAVVDSGVQGAKRLRSRLLKQVDFTPGSGTNTAAATVSATARWSQGSPPARTTATRAPSRAPKIVSLDVLDDAGAGT